MSRQQSWKKQWSQLSPEARDELDTILARHGTDAAMLATRAILAQRAYDQARIAPTEAQIVVAPTGLFPLLGRSMPSAMELGTAAKQARDLGCTAIQIFAGDPEAYRPISPTPQAIKTFRSIVGQAKIRLVVLHASLLINLATEDKGHRGTSIHPLCRAFQQAQALRARYVVVHAGKVNDPGGTAEGIHRLADGIAQAIKTARVTLGPDLQLLIENGAAKKELGKTPEQLRAILTALPPNLHPYTSVCFDLAHAYVAGYDLATLAGFQQLCAEIEGTIGFPRLQLIHLNNSYESCGSYRDRHARWGDEQGKMLLALLSWLRKHMYLQTVPLIMETPFCKNEDAIDWKAEQRHWASVKQALVFPAEI